MTKAELIERTIDRITDPWTESCEMYEDAELIDLAVAKDVLAQCREEDLDMDEEDRLPAEVTAEIMLEAYNCNVRKNKHDLRIQRLAEWIKANECVCEYVNYYLPEHDSSVNVIPVDFLSNSDYFPFMNNATPLDILCIGMNSRKTFDPQDEFCWFDSTTMTLHSTDHPFGNDILDAEDFARFILLDADALGYFVDCLMDDDEIHHVFGCTKEELIHED